MAIESLEDLPSTAKEKLSGGQQRVTPDVRVLYSRLLLERVSSGTIRRFAWILRQFKMSKYRHNEKPEEEYIDLVPILDDLYFDPAAFLAPIKKGPGGK